MGILVKEIMKTAIAVEKNLTIKKASEIMSEKDINSLIIVESDEVIGIITDEDLVDNFGKKGTIEKFMTKNVVTIDPDDDVDIAISLIKKRKIGVIPVVDKKKGLVGVINTKDILSETVNPDHFLIE